MKMTFSKIKKLCSVVLIPRILRGQVTLSPQKMGRRPLDGFRKMLKSTDSKDGEAECEKCKKIIGLVFGHEKPHSVQKHIETNIENMQIDNIQKVITKSVDVNEKLNENNLLPLENKTNELESVEKLCAKKIDESVTKKSQNILPLDNILQSTTAKTAEEQLTQKLETIEEPGVVEAATSKIEGFNVPPKVLGGQESKLDIKNLCTKIAPEEDEMEKIAKKCLGTPPDKIDERILEEMISCGMLRRGRRKPISSKRRDHVMKYNEKEPLLELKSELTRFYCRNQQKPNKHTPHKNHLDYFKNVHTELIPLENTSEKRDEQKITTTIKENEEKSTLEDITTMQEQQISVISPYNSVAIDSMNPVLNNQVNNRSEEMDNDIIDTGTTEEDTFTEIIENVEGEIEEIRVTAADTNHLGKPGESEIDPDFDHTDKKTIIYMDEKTSELGEYKNVALMTAEHPRNWQSHPYNTSNTTSSGGAYPPSGHTSNPEEPYADSAISSHQDPGEYYDLSNCKMKEVSNEYAINLSEIPPYAYAAYHQYTIITGTDEEINSDEGLFTIKETPEILTSVWESIPQFEKQDLPSTIHKDMSTVMGTMPQLKDVQEESSLTDMLRRDGKEVMGTMPQLKDVQEESSLTDMLRRVRERNRLEYCRDCAFKALEVEPAEAANKCPPPVEKSKSKSKAKPACPPPCPPPQEKKTCPPPCPPACPPSKPKNPCAKFSTGLITYKVKEIFALVLQVVSKSAITSQSASQNIKKHAVEPLKSILNREHRIENLGSFLLSDPEGKNKRFKKNIVLTKDYEPWSPIPSWPIPRKEKKKPFVCPKEGCKLIPPPKLLDPCNENPCKGLPKRTFSLMGFVDNEPLFLYYNEY